MRIRRTTENKSKALMIRLTLDEHIFVKCLSAERGWSISKFVLEAVRLYINKRT